MKVFSIIIMFSVASVAAGQNQEGLVNYKKGACFGQCPMYDIEVNEDGLLTFIGKRFIDQLGTHERQLTRREFRKLKRLLRRAKFHKVPFLDESNIMDAQLTTFIYKDQKIARKTGIPMKLQKSEAFLLSLSPMSKENQHDWKITPPVEIKREDIGRKENAQPEIIVQMAPEVDFNSWLQGYHKYGLGLKKKLVPNRELYLLSFEPKMMSFKALLKKLASDKAVQSAEENKKVKQR